MMAKEQERQRESPSAFRQQALEYISTPKALDDLVQVASPLTWVLAAAIWLILAVIILWLCFGSIATYVDGQGMLLTDNGAVVYISALAGQRVQPGMVVQIGPNTVRSWEYRRIAGRVTAVENFPATPENMLVILKNPSLVNYFIQAGPVITIKVELKRSLGPVPNNTLAPGSLVDVRIITRRQSPLSLILSP